MKTNKRKQTELLSFQVIEKATMGDILALNVVLKHYERYIKNLSTRKAFDEFGKPYYYVDQTLKGILENKLIKKTLNFKLIR